MTTRITLDDIDRVLRRINDALGVPNSPYATDENGKIMRGESSHPVVNVGSVYLSGAYGGVRFEQMCEGGGSRDLLSTGYVSKRDLHRSATAYLAGLETRK